MKEKTDTIAGGEMVQTKFANATDIHDIIENPFDLPVIDEFMGDVVKKLTVLTKFNIEEGEFGPFVILEFEGSSKYRTGGKAIVSQCQRISNSGKHCPIKVCIEKCSSPKGDYFSLMGKVS